MHTTHMASLTRAEKRGLRCSAKLTFGTEQWSVMGLRSKLKRRQWAKRLLVTALVVGGAAAVAAFLPQLALLSP